MSWSIVAQCFGCKKASKCSDYQVISGATNIIHSIGSDRGHLGAGIIGVDCENFEKEDIDS